MKRWIALTLGIAIALAAAYAGWQRHALDAVPIESISASSRAQLDAVVRRTASLPRSEPKASGDAHQAASEKQR